MEPTYATCDGCGLERLVGPYDSYKPDKWYSREDSDGRQIACSRECIDAIAAKTGKTRVVLPF